MKKQARLSFALILTVVLPVIGNAADLKKFDKSIRIIKVSDIKLSRDQKNNLRGFRNTKRYFGAFAINPQSDISFWTRDFSSLNAAKKSALKGCEIYSKNDENDNPADTKKCLLHTISVPKGISVNDDNAMGLSSSALKSFNGRYQSKQKANKFGAFAHNQGPNFGMSWNYKSEAEARETALSYCEAGVARDRTQFDSEARAFAKSTGFDKCEIVHVIKGD